MDFVQGLGDTDDVMEIPVDGLGRVEVHRGRVRVTLTRIVERKGVAREVPCLTLVWSAQAWLEARDHYTRMHSHIRTTTLGMIEQELMRSSH